MHDMGDCISIENMPHMIPPAIKNSHPCLLWLVI